MSNTSIQLKKSGATGNTPTGLAFGEVAINYADGKLYYKNALGGTSYISNQFSFDTINANNSLILATGVSDTLSFVAGNNITISTNTTTKTITINSSGGSTDQFARDAANSAGLYANAAFEAANSGGSSTDQTARNIANASFTQANAAFELANTLSVSSNNLGYFNRSYTGDNTTTNFTVTNGVTNNSIIVTENGIVQAPSTDYYVSGSNVIFTVAPTSSVNIGIRELASTGNVAVSSERIEAAFIQANAAFGVANTDVTNINITSATYGNTTTVPVITVAANGRIISISNTTISGGGGSGEDNVARDTANSAALYANGAFAQANTATTDASTADSKAVTAGSYANSAYTQANTATNNAAGASLYANGAFIQANAAFDKANSVTGGFRANTVIIANSTGYLSNSNAEFSLANNTLYVQNANVSSELTANSLVFYDGTRLNSATGISANTANSAATANVSIFARVTNVTTGTYFPIVTDTTVTGADTFHYSSNDFLMYAANNTFRASGNLWAGQFITVGTNIPVVNSTGHWVGRPLVANNSATANVSNVAVNARITNVTTGTYFPIVTDTTITGADTFHYSSNDFLMYAANNTFRATGNLWAGQFITVGTNIPVVNSTGHWVGQTLTSIDETARSTANSAGSYANAAFLQANAAFAAANLASSNVYSFVGTGSCTSFTLSTTNNPSSNTIIVNIDGVIQLHSTYDVTSNVINFTEAPASNAEIEVQIIAGASGSPNSLTITPEVNTTSGTSVVLTTAIPSWAKRITVNFYGISLNGTQLPLIQFGTGATPTWATSGYDSSSDNYATTAGPVVGSTAGFLIGSTTSAAQVHNGAYTFTLVGSNKWVGTMNGNLAGGGSVLFGGGRVSLSGEVTAIRLFSNGGTNTYDAGSASVMYE